MTVALVVVVSPGLVVVAVLLDVGSASTLAMSWEVALAGTVAALDVAGSVVDVTDGSAGIVEVLEDAGSACKVLATKVDSELSGAKGEGPTGPNGARYARSAKMNMAKASNFPIVSLVSLRGSFML